MKLKKEENSTKSKSQFFIIGSLLIVVGIVLVSQKYLCQFSLKKEEQSKIEQFYQEDVGTQSNGSEEESIKEENKIMKTISYIAVLKIPKIKLEKGLCSIGTSCNNVNQNIEILKESTFPNEEKSNLILVSHSGTSNISYFKNLDKLNINDTLSISYNGKDYLYKIVNIYDIEKNGTANIIRNQEKKTITLITCRRNTNKQIVVIGELVEEKNYGV